MSRDFTRGPLNRERSLEELEEDMRKVKPGELKIEPRLGPPYRIGDDVAVRGQVIFHPPDGRSQAHNVILTLTREDGAWKLRRWDLDSHPQTRPQTAPAR